MKKAVAYLIPFMEEEKAKQLAEATDAGETVDAAVSYSIKKNLILQLFLYRLIIQVLWF